MVASLAQTPRNGTSSATTCTVNMTSAQTAGNCNAILISAGNGNVPTSVADSKFNAYTLRGSRLSTASGDGSRLLLYSCDSIVAATAGSNTITVTGLSENWDAYVYEIAGGVTFDATPTGTSANTGTTMTGASITPGGATGIVIAFFNCGSSFSAAGTGYTQGGSTSGFANGSVYKIFSTNAALTPTATQSSSTVWDEFAGTFLVASTAASDIIPMIGGGRRPIDLPHYRMRGDEEGARKYLRRQCAVNERGQPWA